jgi:hypothetical protein
LVSTILVYMSREEHEPQGKVVERSASDTVAIGGVKEFIKLNGKVKGHKRPIFERQAGDQFARNEGIWAHKVRLIDRENDRYHELVVDPATGKVLRHCDEPLSLHRGGGVPKTGQVPPSTVGERVNVTLS